MPCEAITRCSTLLKASSDCGSSRNRGWRRPLRCAPTVRAPGDRMRFINWWRRMPGGCRSSGPGGPLIPWVVDRPLPDGHATIRRRVHSVAWLHVEGFIELGLIDERAYHANKRYRV